jgi:phosphatidylserine/phosphatidylglycerophosphate/cardiolipin synthase-like enzyme
MNRRSHDKILLIDAQSEENSMAIIGGRNIAKRYYLTAEEAATPTLDAEILIRGLAQRKEDGSI